MVGGGLEEGPLKPPSLPLPHPLWQWMRCPYPGQQPQPQQQLLPLLLPLLPPLPFPPLWMWLPFCAWMGLMTRGEWPLHCWPGF